MEVAVHLVEELRNLYVDSMQVVGMQHMQSDGAAHIVFVGGDSDSVISMIFDLAVVGEVDGLVVDL